MVTESEEGLDPRHGGWVREPHATGTKTGGIVGTNESRGGGDQFVQPRRAVGEVAVDPAKVVEGSVEGGSETEPRSLSRGESVLEVTEQSACAGQGQRH
jgi:hypothetical protein